MIKPKGRPATQCAHCRDLRKNKQHHTSCSCGAGTLGKHGPKCPCVLNKELCTCSKKKKKQPSAPLSVAAATPTSNPLSSKPHKSSSPINIPVSKNATFQHNGIDKSTRAESANSGSESKRRKGSKTHASSASLSKLSLFSDLTPSPPEDAVRTDNSPIPVFLNFNQSNTRSSSSSNNNNNKEYQDLVSSLDALGAVNLNNINNNINNTINHSTTSLSSHNSGFATSSSLTDGSMSDIDTPLQMNFGKISLLDTGNGIVGVRNVGDDKKRAGSGNEDISFRPADLETLGLLSPTDSYGILDFIDNNAAAQQQRQHHHHSQYVPRALFHSTSRQNTMAAVSQMKRPSSLPSSQQYYTPHNFRSQHHQSQAMVSPHSLANVSDDDLSAAGISTSKPSLFPLTMPDSGKLRKDNDYKAMSMGDPFGPLIVNPVSAEVAASVFPLLTPTSPLMADGNLPDPIGLTLGNTAPIITSTHPSDVAFMAATDNSTSPIDTISNNNNSAPVNFKSAAAAQAPLASDNQNQLLHQHIKPDLLNLKSLNHQQHQHLQQNTVNPLELNSFSPPPFVGAPPFMMSTGLGGGAFDETNYGMYDFLVSNS